MRSRILLVNANRCATPDPVFPLGLAYLSAALHQAGHECLWLDALADAEQFEQTLQTLRPDFVGVSLRNIDDVLIRKRELFFTELPALITSIRRRTGCPIILGGSAFSLFPERLMELSEAEFGVVGEGESALLALVAALKNGSRYHSIPGLAFRRKGKVIVNQPDPEPVHWRLLGADRPPSLTNYYLRNSSMLNLQTQRGCPHRCCYCTYPLIEGRRHRCRPADMVAEEFEQLQSLGARYLFIVDSVFNSSPRHVTEVCEALLKRQVKIPWGCFLRPQGLTTELMRLMARAGLAHIEFGSDSFCDEVLTAYGKDFTFEDIQRSSELARQEKIDFCHYLIAGGPGETPGTLAEGFESSQRLPGAVILAVVGMRLYPGTALFERACSQGQVSPQTDLLNPAYYLAPGLNSEEVFNQLQDFARRSPNWLVGEPDSSFNSLVTRLRQRGVAGPLWSYFSLVQQLRPHQLAAG